MYDLQLTTSWFPAQGGKPEQLMTIDDMLRKSAAEHSEWIIGCGG